MQWKKACINSLPEASGMILEKKFPFRWWSAHAPLLITRNKTLKLHAYLPWGGVKLVIATNLPPPHSVGK
jgi:hypothetical protein